MPGDVRVAPNDTTGQVGSIAEWIRQTFPPRGVGSRKYVRPVEQVGCGTPDMEAAVVERQGRIAGSQGRRRGPTVDNGHTLCLQDQQLGMGPGPCVPWTDRR